MQKLILRSGLVVGIAVATYLVARACAGGMWGEDVRYSIFDKETSDNSSLAPFYFTTDFIYNINNTSGNERGMRENDAEWAKYAGLASAKDVHEAVYGFDLAKTEKWLKDIAKSGTTTLADNTFAAKLAADKNISAVEYLVFAKKCESSSQKYSEDWEDAKPLPQATYDAKIAAARMAFQKEKDTFLKQRYGYQLVMLLRYKADWAACTKAFDDCVEPFGNKSIVYWWALAHKATATHFLGEKEKADYYFAQVFAHDDYKKHRMNQGYGGDNFKKSLEFCKNNQEKAALHTLEAIHNPGRTLENLQKVYELAPESENLDFLLVREVNKLEDWILTPRMTGGSSANEMEAREDVAAPKDNDMDYNKIKLLNAKSDELYGNKVLNWVKTVANNPKLHNPALWHTATAHIALMLNNYEEAKTWVASAQKAKGKTPAIDRQIHLTGIMTRINFDKNKSMSHDDLYKDMVWMRKEAAELDKKQKPSEYGYDRNNTYNKWILALAERAEKQNNVTMAALFYAESDSYVEKDWHRGYNSNDTYIYYLDKNGSTQQVEEILAMITVQQKDNLIKILTDSLGKHVNRLKDVLGTKYLREDNLEKSAAIYETIPKEWFKEKTCGYTIYDTYLRKDPFWAGVQDGKPLRYSRKGFVLRLMGLKEEAKDPNNKNQAWAQYQVANGYYNISTHGNAWARSRYWKGYDDGDLTHEDLKDREYNTAERAKKAYQLAADMAKSKEFKALCLRMVAQCELHELEYRDMITKANENEKYNAPTFKETATGAFLKKNYGDYYKKLTGDCAGWTSFMAKGKL